jgi:hypothetical protein
MSQEKRILFLCGSPQEDKSSSLLVARYLSHFLKQDFEFIDVAAANLSFDASESEAAFQRIVHKMETAACIVWVFGAVCWHPPVQLKLLFDKLFQQGFLFTKKIAATVMTGGHFLDDYILEHMRFISEQLGFGYLGDVSAEGIAGGYVDYEETESACRVLARMIHTALDEGYIPYRETALWRREDLMPLHFGNGFVVHEDPRNRKGSKNIVVVTGYKLDFRTCPLSRNSLCSLTNIGFETQEVYRLTKDGIGHDLIEVLWPAVVLAHPVPRQVQDAHERFQVAQVPHFFAAGVEEQSERSRIVVSPLFNGQDDGAHEHDGRVRDERVEVPGLTAFLQAQELLGRAEEDLDVPPLAVDAHHVGLGQAQVGGQ